MVRSLPQTSKRSRSSVISGVISGCHWISRHPLNLTMPQQSGTSLSQCSVSRKQRWSLARMHLLRGRCQGGNFTDLRERAGREVTDLGFSFCPIGAVVPLMESYRYQDLVNVVMAARRTLSPSVCVHLFGAGHPSMFALATAMGCDLFDSAAYALYAKEGRYLTTHGSFRINDLADLPCACTICRSHTAEELCTAPDRERLLALHNLYVTLARSHGSARQFLMGHSGNWLMNDAGGTHNSSLVTGLS